MNYIIRYRTKITILYQYELHNFHILILNINSTEAFQLNRISNKLSLKHKIFVQKINFN